jgi:hypothetical protein
MALGQNVMEALDPGILDDNLMTTVMEWQVEWNDILQEAFSDAQVPTIMDWSILDALIPWDTSNAGQPLQTTAK